MGTSDGRPPTMSQGRGAERAFERNADLLPPGEPATAFLYGFGGTVILASEARTLTWRDGSHDDRVELPPLGELHLAERGVMRIPHLVSGATSLKVVLPRTDLDLLTGLVRSDPPPDGPTLTVAPQNLAEATDQLRDLRDQYRQHRDRKRTELDAKLEDLKAKQDARLAKKGEDPAIIGRKVTSQIFANRSITIYENGYVKVRGLLGGSPEKLLQITSSADVTKKTGLGRAVGAVASAGWNMIGSNKRGDVYLVIVTDRTTHTLHTDQPYAHDIRAARTLEAAGQATLARVAALGSTPTEVAGAGVPSSAASPPPPAAPDLTAQLSTLAELHRSGVLSDDEFAAAKARLLDPTV